MSIDEEEAEEAEEAEASRECEGASEWEWDGREHDRGREGKCTLPAGVAGIEGPGSGPPLPPCGRVCSSMLVRVDIVTLSAARGVRPRPR
jgi:hypothetical protein